MKEETKKLKFVKIKRFEDGAFLGGYINTPKEVNVILDEINEATRGTWHLQIVWMTQAEYDALPEFAGY